MKPKRVVSAVFTDAPFGFRQIVVEMFDPGDRAGIARLANTHLRHPGFARHRLWQLHLQHPVAIGGARPIAFHGGRQGEAAKKAAVGACAIGPRCLPARSAFRLAPSASRPAPERRNRPCPRPVPQCARRCVWHLRTRLPKHRPPIVWQVVGVVNFATPRQIGSIARTILGQCARSRAAKTLPAFGH